MLISTTAALLRKMLTCCGKLLNEYNYNLKNINLKKKKKKNLLMIILNKQIGLGVQDTLSQKGQTRSLKKKIEEEEEDILLSTS